MKRFEKSLGLAVTAVVSVTSLTVQAALIRVPPGQEAGVYDGSPVNDWSLSGSGLYVGHGGETGKITAQDKSWVNMDGGKVTSHGAVGVALFNSSAVINNSVIIGSADPERPGNSSFGIRLSGFQSASSAQVSNSFVSGVDRGINVTDSATLLLSNSRVEGHPGESGAGFVTGGAGIVVAGAFASITEHSVVQGDQNGLVTWADATWDVEVSPRVTVDNSSIEGLTGSAIVITRTPTAEQDVFVDVQNHSTLTGGNGVVLDIQKGSTGHVNVDNSQLTGDVRVEEGSIGHLALVNQASLTGNISNASTLKIDATSLWAMQGNSDVGALELSGGTVDMRGNTADFQTLTLGALAGSGTFVLGTDLANLQGDKLAISGNATGQHQLLVENSGVEPSKGGASLQVVQAGSGDAQFSLVGEKVDFGTFAYELEQQENGIDDTDGIDWSLVQTEELSAGSRSVISLFSAAPTVWYGESATLRSRMGELRNGNDQGGGWMRSYGNKYNMSAGGGVAYQQNQQGITFGADAPLPTSNGQWLIGVLGGYSKSDLDMKQGTSGEVDSYYVGAYTTWLADDGFYVDALIKTNRFQNSSDVMMRDGEKSKGDYVNHGVGASVEAGKHIKLDDQWFVEPFAQVTGLWVSGQDYDLDNGMQASSNQANSLLGKVGTQVGRTFALENGGFVQPYVKVAGAQEFVTSNRVTINDNRFSNDLSGSRLELGTGVVAQLTDVLQVHADLDYMNGRNIEQPWGVNVGLRYNW